MIIVGLTGGIGSGKTTAAKQFKKLGVPIYIADVEAKALMNRSKIIKRKLIQLFGEAAYKNNKLNKPFIASQIFTDKLLLKQMNAIVHPKVATHFKRWLKKHDTPYCIKEVAILFENGSYKQCDFIITVTASKNERIKRVVKRDKTTKEKVLAIINNQMPEEEKIKLSNFVIYNEDLEILTKQVEEIHNQLLKEAKKN
jgi:dephospho-CoA kinase